jgi:hypothetical protein
VPQIKEEFIYFLPQYFVVAGYFNFGCLLIQLLIPISRSVILLFILKGKFGISDGYLSERFSFSLFWKASSVLAVFKV